MSELENTIITQTEAPAEVQAEAPPAEPPAEQAPEPESRHPRPESEEFDSLVNSFSQFSHPATGTMLKGHVVKITDSEAIVDVGYKCEGIVPIEECKDEKGNLQLQSGDDIEVMMESTEERDGYVVLSWQKARRIRVWDNIETAYQRQTPISGRVVERIKGGLVVDIGVRAFLPGSQVDIRPFRNLDALMGEEISCKILKLNKKRGNIVVSRKAHIEEETRSRKQQTLAMLQEGAVLPGTVKNITDYGAFVDLGGIDGLLHVSDLSWGRVNHPSEVISVGDQLQVKVLKFDREKERVSLGLKQLSEDPWLSVQQKFPVGARASGKVLNVTDYGAFVELAPGLEGLVHVSEMSWSKRIKHPSKIVSPGDSVETVVLGINPVERRISLGLKQAEPNPWSTLAERYAVGSVVQGRVRNLTDFGAFVEIEDGIDGLVHVSDISWTRRIRRPAEVLKKGEIVQAVVLNIDPENRRLSLGIKQLQPDVWESFCAANRVGDKVQGKVVRKASFGVFVELAEGIEGLCHISEVVPEPADRRSIPLEEGQELEFRIVKLIPGEKKIGLSLKAFQEEPGRQEPEKTTQLHSSSGATSTIEEMVAMKERNSQKH